VERSGTSRRCQALNSCCIYLLCLQKWACPPFLQENRQPFHVSQNFITNAWPPSQYSVFWRIVWTTTRQGLTLTPPDPFIPIETLFLKEQQKTRPPPSSWREEWGSLAFKTYQRPLIRIFIQQIQQRPAFLLGTCFSRMAKNKTCPLPIWPHSFYFPSKNGKISRRFPIPAWYVKCWDPISLVRNFLDFSYF
jgi:hypothetical protein